MLSEREEWVATQIVDAAYTVHRKLGPGLLEKIYEKCFCYELDKRGVKYRRQVYMPIKYDDVVFEDDDLLRLDVFVEDLVVCELKAVVEVNQLFKAQVLSYLQHTERRLGFLINFNVVRIKDGISRFIR